MTRQKADSITALPSPLQLLRLLSSTALSTCLMASHREAKETKIISTLCVRKDDEHSRRLGQGEAFRSGTPTALASLDGGHEASNVPLASLRLPGEGQRPPREGLGSDTGTGKEVTQSAHHCFSQGLRPQLTCSSAEPTQPINQARQHPEQMVTHLGLPTLTRSLSRPQVWYTRLARQEDTPLAHGLLVHLSTFFSQLEPVKLGGHSQA